MNRKIIYTIISASAALGILTGCSSSSKTTVVETPSSEQELVIITETPDEPAPKLNIGNGHTNDSLDLQTIAANALKAIESKGYDLDAVSIDAPNERNNFFNIIIVANNEPADENEYIKWCSETLTFINEEAVKLDPEYSPASEGYYGGLFDQYSFLITATNKDDVTKKWAVYQTVEAGTHVPIKITNAEFDLGM